MPLRDHLDIILNNTNFFRLSTSEEHALTVFNSTFEQARTVIANRAHQHFISLNTQKNPHYSADPTSLTQLRDKVLNQDFSRFSLIVPAEISALSAVSLIKLAFHPDGKYFHKYLQDVINAEIFKRSNYCEGFPSGEFSEQEKPSLIAKLNKLSTAELDKRLNYSEPSTNIFYQQIESLFKQNNRQESDLLCTNNALEFIASTYLRSIILNRKLTGLTTDNYRELIIKVELTTQEETLLCLAAIYGSYKAAYDISLRAAHAIGHSKTLEEAVAHYRRFDDTFLTIAEQTTPNLLLSVEVHLSFLTLGKKKRVLVTDSTVETETENQLWLTVCDRFLITIYQTLMKAELSEHTDKNALRLAFETDTCAVRLWQLLPRHIIGNPKTFMSITDTRQFFSQQCSHLNLSMTNPNPLRDFLAQESTHSAITYRP